MSNFDEKDPVSIARFVRERLSEHELVALATVNEDGTPWVVCVGLSFDKQINIIWKSMRSTVHSQNIARDPRVALSLFSKTKEHGDFGFYAKALAREVTDKQELAECTEIRYRQKGKEVPSFDTLLGEAPARIYKAEIQEAWVNDDRHVKAPIDIRILKQSPQ